MRTHRDASPFLAVAGLLVLVAGLAACDSAVGGAGRNALGSAPAGASQLAAGEPGGSDGSAAPTLLDGLTPAPGDTVTGAPTSNGTGRAATPVPVPTGPTAPTTGPTPGPTPVPATQAPAGPCYVFPSSNVWNRDISGLPVASNSAAMVNAIGAGSYVHPDFDAVGDGIPVNVVTSSTPTYTVPFQYADESDPGPYPIPSSPAIEGGSDRHLISIDVQQCKLWELYAVSRSGSGWTAGSGAVFDLKSNALRPAGWTSADAAGLPIFPGLVRYSEVSSGVIYHALRFTAPDTCGYIYPATHLTAPACSSLPPMGLRVRLKASVDISGFGPNAQVVLRALKKYGMILADNGSPWYISGSPSSHWNDDEFHKLQTLHGSDFEVVNTSGLRNG